MNHAYVDDGFASYSLFLKVFAHPCSPFRNHNKVIRSR